MQTYKSDHLFLTLNGLFILFVSALMVAPMIHVVALSLSAPDFVNYEKVYFWPKGLSLDVYAKIFAQGNLWRALGVSVYITVMGTLVSLLLTTSFAYSLSRSRMPYRRLILKGIILTFIFSVPFIPFYLVVKAMGMYNTLWALVIPNAMGAFNVIIMKTFFQGISAEIFDAAYMDGCSEFGIYSRIAIPLSLPSIATIGLFHAVGQWNSYFNALIFLRGKGLYPLQILLRNLIMQEQFANELDGFDVSTFTPEQLKAGVILFATVPILLVYPFIQKYFVKGAMLGSVKE